MVGEARICVGLTRLHRVLDSLIEAVTPSSSLISEACPPLRRAIPFAFTASQVALFSSARALLVVLKHIITG